MTNHGDYDDDHNDTTCALCCQLLTYSAFAANINVFFLVHSLLLGFSVVFISFRLYLMYKRSYEIARRPIVRLLPQRSSRAVRWRRRLQQLSGSSPREGRKPKQPLAGSSDGGSVNGRAVSTNTDAASAAGTLVDIDFRGVSSENSSDAGHLGANSGGQGGSGVLPRMPSDDSRAPGGQRRANSNPERARSRERRGAKKKNKKPDHVDWTFIHPAFYILVVFAVIVIVIESFTNRGGGLGSLVWLRFVMFGIVGLPNLYVLFHIMGQRPYPGRAALAALLTAGVGETLGIMLPGNIHCWYCSLELPKSSAAYMLLGEGIVYLLALMASMRAPKIQVPRGRRLKHVVRHRVWVRPTAKPFLMLVSASGFSGFIGASLLQWANSEIGFCVLGAASVLYVLAWPIVVFSVCVEDSRYCHRLDTIAVLEGLRAPLLGTATREDRNSRPKDSPGGDVGGVAGDGITLRTNSLSRISERQLSAQLSGTNLANRMAHVSRDLHGLLQDASVNLISPDELDIVEVLGTGGYGTVSLATWGRTPVAVKTLFNAALKGVEQFLREARSLSALRHPHVVQFLGVSIEAGKYQMVTEYLPRGNCWQLLHKVGVHHRRGPLPLTARHTILEDTALGMAYLHNRRPTPLLHRDLKSPNLLLDAQLRVKVCDFGLARFDGGMTGAGHTTTTAVVGTAQWTAPEVFLGQEHTTASDVYSFGIVVWEMCSLQTPFDGQSMVHVGMQVALKHTRPPLPHEAAPQRAPRQQLAAVSVTAGDDAASGEADRTRGDDTMWPPHLVALMKACWAPDPEARPSFNRVCDALADFGANTDAVLAGHHA